MDNYIWNRHVWKSHVIEPCSSCLPERPNIFIELFEHMENESYHEDVIERCKYALRSTQGIVVFLNLPKKYDYEYIVQSLLDVYKEITKG